MAVDIERFDPERETCAQWAQRQLNTIAAQTDGDPQMHSDRLLDVLDQMRDAIRELRQETLPTVADPSHNTGATA